MMYGSEPIPLVCKYKCLQDTCLSYDQFEQKISIKYYLNLFKTRKK